MKPYNVTIETVLNGWVVKVGCATVVFTDSAKLLADLKDYLVDPKAMIKLYKENSINADMFNLAYVGEEQLVRATDEAIF